MRKIKSKHPLKSYKALALSHEEKQIAAYYRWRQRGSPLDDAMADWVAAERIPEEEEGLEWEGEERRWDEKFPRDDEPGEVP